MDKKKRVIRDYIFIIVGSFLISVASLSIYDRAELVIGGVTGVSIIIRHLFSVPLWLSYTLINVPLFVIGFFTKGGKFLFRTIVSTLLCSFFLFLLPAWEILPKDDFFLASVVGGIFMGLGCGMVFISNSTTGGTDLLAAILQTKFKHISMAKLVQFVDSMVILWGLQIFGVRKALYALVSIYVFTKVCEAIMEGMHFAKAVTIISHKGDEIANYVITTMHRGVTGLDAKGMYTKKGITMLYCVLSNREVSNLKDVVNDMDDKAFFIISDVREVHGEGFIRRDELV